MKRAGLDPLPFHGRSTRAFGVETADALLDVGADAAVCFNDLVALGLHAGFARAGKTLGTDFRIVGFDDIEDCALVWPQLSSVACDIGGFARATADRLLAWMQDGESPPPDHRAPVELVARASSTGRLS